MIDSSASNPHAAMIRVEPKNASRYAGQRRHDLRIGHQPDYVDADRAHLNRVLIAPPTAADLRSVCEDRRAQRDTRRAMKANASVGMVGLIGFGTEAQALFSALPVLDQDRALRLAARLAARRMGTTVAGLVFHGDETAPHAHVVFPAYDRTGQPLTETVGRAVLKGLQDDMAAAFSRYAPGIERGRSRMDRLAAGADYADTVNRSVRELHRDLPAEIAAKRAEAEAAGAALVAAQGRAEEMQGRVDKLTALARDLTAAEAKRLVTYEKRLAERQAEVARAESAIEAARAETARLSGMADAAEARREVAEVEAAAVIDAAGQKAGQITQKAVAVATAVAALAEEMAEGTLGRDSAGKIVARDPERLRPGLPDIRQALNAGADARAALDRDRADLADKIRAADEERGRLAALRDAVESGLRRAEDALRSVLTLAPRIRRMIGDKTVSPAERPVWRQARADLVEVVPPLRDAVREGRDRTRAIMDALRASPPAEKPVPEADPDDGPGFGEP